MSFEIKVENQNVYNGSCPTTAQQVMDRMKSRSTNPHHEEYLSTVFFLENGVLQDSFFPSQILRMSLPDSDE